MDFQFCNETRMGYGEKLNGQAGTEKMSVVHNFGLWRDLSHAGASAPLVRASRVLSGGNTRVNARARIGSKKWGVKCSRPIYSKVCKLYGVGITAWV